MSQISISHLTYRYPGAADPVLRDLSLTLDTDWKLALTGRNGRGKTTFLRLLSGGLPSDRGTLACPVPFAYFPFSVPEEYDALSALYCARPELELWRLKREMRGLDLPEDVLEKRLGCLCAGEKTKLLLAALFAQETEHLLIDEPTNHLDETGRRRLAAYLKEKRGSILVSHDRDLLDACCDHILVFEAEGATLRKGSFSDWQRDKAAADAAAREKNERLARQIDALQVSAERASAWADKVEASKNKKVSGLRPDKGHISAMAAKMARRAKNTQRRREEAIREKSGLLKNAEFYGELKLAPLSFRAQTLCDLSHVCAGYGGKCVLEDVSLEIGRGERIAVKGANGCGKSTLLKIAAGVLCPEQGELFRPNDLIVSYLPQDVQGLAGMPADFAEAHGADPALVMAILNKLNVPGALFRTDLSRYSAGQKKKALLAVSLATPAHLYIWDEPLNYIDLVSRMQLEELLLRYAPALLFVEHDAAFARNVATRTVSLQ